MPTVLKCAKIVGLSDRISKSDQVQQKLSFETEECRPTLMCVSSKNLNVQRRNRDILFLEKKTQPIPTKCSGHRKNNALLFFPLEMIQYDFYIKMWKLFKY